jgi:integrase/recombinase XerD
VKTSRDRAVVSVLFESSLRPFELLELTWGDIKTDVHGAVINTAGKTGKPRYVRLIHSAEPLNTWRNDYPEEIKNNSPVFVNTNSVNHHSLTRGALKKIIAKAAKAVPGKRVHPYLFRHSRITEMMALGVPESVIKMQAWGSLSTPMMATYAHLSNDQQDAFLIAAAGGDTARARPKATASLTPITCLGCRSTNDAGATYCKDCASPLDPIKFQAFATSKAPVDELRTMVMEQQKKIDSLMVMLEQHYEVAQDTLKPKKSLKGYKSAVSK